MDERSFYLDTETMLLIKGKLFTEKLKEVVFQIKEKNVAYSYDSTKTEMSDLKAPLSKRILICIVSVFSRLFQFLI